MAQKCTEHIITTYIVLGEPTNNIARGTTNIAQGAPTLHRMQPTLHRVQQSATIYLNI